MDNSPTFELSDRPLAPSQTNIEHMYAAGVEIFVSSDGGQTWVETSTSGLDDFDVHNDIRGFSYCGYDPITDEDLILAATDGGISFSNQSGDARSWENINDYYLNSLDTELPGISYRTGDLFAGAWHNGFMFRELGANDWTRFNSFDESEVVVDNLIADGERIYRTAWDQVVLVSDYTHYSSGNFTVQYLGHAAPTVSAVVEITPTYRPKVAINPSNNNEVFFSAKRVHRLNISPTNITKSAIFNQFSIFEPERRDISALKVSPDGKYLYIALEQGHSENSSSPLYNFKVFKIQIDQANPQTTNLTPYLNNDGNVHPNSDAHKSWLGYHFIRDFMIDSENSDIVFACLSDYSDQNFPARVIYSVDGGVNWVDYSGSLPLIPTSKLLLRGNELYLATDMGVYKTPYVKNYNAQGEVTSFASPNWTCMNLNLPNCAVNGLTLNPCKDELVISTWGHGIWKTSLDPISAAISTLQVSTSQTWSGTKEVTQNIEVPSGVTLTITGNVFMHGSESSIHIKPGGHLIIDGGLITSNCKDWLGIFVEGNSSLAQTTVNQGKISVINGGEITNARDAITNTAVNQSGGWVPGTTGGIIYCNQALFRNNKRDIQLLPYRDWVSNNADYDAKFINSDFTRDDDFKLDAILPSITMWGVVGVAIEDCKFENAHSNNWAYRGGGIYSIGATFKVQDNTALSQRTGCEFTGYYDAIRSQNTFCGQASKHTEIKRATFRDNYHAIYISHPSLVRITYNDIEVNSQLSPSQFPSNFQTAKYGIYLDGEGTYILHNNVLKTDGPNGGIPAVGIVLRDNGNHINQPYGNEIDGFDVGIEALGRNRDRYDAYGGIQFKCNNLGATNSLSSSTQNTSYSNQTDIFVTGGGPGANDEQGVALQQGDFPPNGTAKDLAGNLFSDNSNSGHLVNATTNNIHYYAGDPITQPSLDPRLIPASSPRVFVYNSNIPQDYLVDCTARSEGNGKTISDYLADYTNAEVELSLRQSQISSWLNGGNTATLESQILFASNQQEYQELYVDLMDASPFVENELLLQVVGISDFPELALRNVMIANPHASREGEVWDALLARVPMLSQQTLDDIQLGTQTTTAFDVLNMQAGIAIQQSQYASIELLQSYSNDVGVNHTTAIRTHLKNRLEPEFRYMLIDDYLSTGNAGTAQSELALIPAECEMSDEATAEYQAMLIWYNVVIDNLNSLEDLDASDVSILTGLAQDPEGYRAAGLARALLELNNASIDYTEPIEFPGQGGNKKGSTIKSRPSKYISQFIIFPNPTDALVSVVWSALEIATTTELEISVFDIQGRQLMNIAEVNVSLQRKAINLSHLNNGAYIIKIMDAEGRLLHKENIILEK